MKYYIDQENTSYYKDKGLEIIDPISNGLIGISCTFATHLLLSFILWLPLYLSFCIPFAPICIFLNRTCTWSSNCFLMHPLRVPRNCPLIAAQIGLNGSISLLFALLYIPQLFVHVISRQSRNWTTSPSSDFWSQPPHLQHAVIPIRTR